MHPGFTITVEVHRASRVRFGDVTRTFHHNLDGVFLAPRYSTEPGGDRGSVIIGFSLFGPSGSDILADDRIKTPDDNLRRDRRGGRMALTVQQLGARL
jgi:hypothetical protein